MFNKEWSEYLKKCQYYPELQEWYKEINLVKKQGSINAEEARRIVKDLHFKPVEAQLKVIIIWQPETMNLSSANLLLKFFEEPPSHTLILMVADEKDQLLKTIQSRFQIIPIPKISPQDLFIHLQKKFPDKSPEDLKSLVNLADGDLKKAENEIQSSDQLKEHFTMFSSWMRICYGRGKLGEMKTFVEKISKIGREQQKDFLNYSLRLTRECFISNYGHPSLNKITQFEQEFITKFAPFIHINNGVEITKRFEESIFQIGRNANATVLFMNLSLDMSKLLKIKP
jgi:DNA polymerase-3 subunit delta'